MNEIRPCPLVGDDVRIRRARRPIRRYVCPMPLDPDSCYAVLTARDRRWDGVFFVGVSTTGIYCRPICPARIPMRDRCTFYASAAEAEAAGFRACLRCRPERAPGVAPIDAVSRLVRRAVARIEAGALDHAPLAALADALGVSDRHLRRAFVAELGITPHQHGQTRRIALARHLLRDTGLPVADVASAAGFTSVRGMQAAFRAVGGGSPKRVRAGAGAAAEHVVTLDARPPYDGQALLAFVAARAIPGVEQVGPSGYARTARFGARAGVVAVELAGAHAVRVRCSASLGPALVQVVERVRRMFDLDARPDAIAAHLSRDPRLVEAVAAHPGLRVPGAFDPFELAVRAVLGQQVSVRAATTLARRLVQAFGARLPADVDGLTHAFPAPAELAAVPAAELAAIGLTGGRAATLAALAEAMAADRLDLEPGADPDAAVGALTAIRGIGPWTANYVAMRALGWPDAFVGGDLVVKRALGVTSARAAEAAAASWRPWRAYAVIHLWATAPSSCAPRPPRPTEEVADVPVAR